MTQTELFGPGYAAARHTDFITSHEAAHEVEASGRAKEQRRACLDAVIRNPGMTAAEIAVAVGLERHAPSRRLPELRRIGLVYNGDQRVCREMGSKSITWFPA
jgi:hypothetical protein